MCLNKPITIPKGSDGKSCTVAYASDSSGTNFSYTATDTLKFMSVVCKVGAVSSSDFTNWVEYIGTDGTVGVDGTSITSATISDGRTAIGGTVYTSGTLVIGYSDGTYEDAGIIDCCVLTWTSLTLANGWTYKGEAIGEKANAVSYAIDTQGFLHFRGVLDSLSVSSGIFTTAILGNSGVNLSVVHDWDTVTTVPLVSHIEISAVAGTNIGGYALSRYWNLNTMPPLYLL